MLFTLPIRAVMTSLLLAATGTPAFADPPAKTESAMQCKGPFHELFEASRANKRGVTLYLAGQTLEGVVVRCDEGSLELTSQQYGRIVVRTDRIDAAAMQ
ncbi:hypothetical protein [Tahibacter amnicola]|uniref:MSHA biogenesis protein MshK n=1 Tax=Tahibacter amnicola TaxID=2976241 RepID=A0ABY6BIR4_9GAMM|nr:hypothetical protein [Tahibacter amnicola]UXI69906.1 hypothetical protein N4264_09845 [Tahibacter amnicola]